MKIRKSIHFLRRVRQLDWHRGQLLDPGPDQHSSQQIVEYQDRWTQTPSRPRIWLNGGGNHTTSNNPRLPW
jgi:hypothetical protein